MLYTGAGLVLASVMLALLALFSFMTAGWVVEAMAACNALTEMEEVEERYLVQQDLQPDGGGAVEEDKGEERNYFSDSSEEEESAPLVKVDLVPTEEVGPGGNIFNMTRQVSCWLQ